MVRVLAKAAVTAPVDLVHLMFYVLAGFVVAAACTQVGISGAILLVPFQVSVLGLNSVSVSATGLVFNVISSPAGIVRYWRDSNIDTPLARLVLDDVKRIPLVGEVVVARGWRIEVLEIAGNRIERLLVSRTRDMTRVQASEHVIGVGTAGSAAPGSGERPSRES